jgi:hypothetical protein
MMALAWLPSLILTGCQSTSERAISAAATRGALAAGTTLPDLPGDCRHQEPRLPTPQLGQKWRGLYVAANDRIDAGNARVRRCAGFYDGVKVNFGKGG